MMSTRTLPSLNALRAFEAAARLRSIGAAAQELHVTHGAVSRQVRLLEDTLGIPLFERDGRGVKPNTAGKQLSAAAGEAFARLQQAIDEVRQPQASSALVLGCPGSVLARWMIPRLETLRQNLPALTLHLSAHEGEFAADLAGLDAALLIGTPPWPDSWKVRPLAAERIGPVLSPRMDGADVLKDSTPDALIGMPLLFTASRPQAWPTWASSRSIDPATLSMGTGFDHLYYLLEAAVAGLGIAIAPEPLVADDLANGRLLAPWGFDETGGQWVLCTRRDRNDDRLAALADWLSEQLRGIRT